MSTAEADRFASDLKTNPDLFDDLKRSVIGLGLSGIVEFAKKKGYSIDVGDARAYIESKAQRELTDDQLDRIAGGKGGGSGTPNGVSTSTTAVVVTGPGDDPTNQPQVIGTVAAAVIVVFGQA